MRFGLKTLLVVFVCVSLIFGVCKLYWPVRPQDQEGWEWTRIIQSKQALEIIESPDKVTAFELELIKEWGGDSVLDYKVLKGPYILDAQLSEEIAACLASAGRQNFQSFRTFIPEFDLKLDFERGSSVIAVYVDIDTPRFEVYERNYFVGRQWNAPDFFELAKEVLSKVGGEGRLSTGAISQEQEE